MRLLFITTGYLPYAFSENLCNGKLVYAMEQNGWHVDVISRVDEGPTYSAEWQEPWLSLKQGVHEIHYATGNKLSQVLDTIRSSFCLRIFPEAGIRWAARAYTLALNLCAKNNYDAILTRSPSDIPHIVGLRLKQKLGIRWIANWNDPAAPIWPEPYTHHFSSKEQKVKMIFTDMCLKGADINTFPSQFLLEHFVNYFPFLAQQKCKVIPHIALVDNLIPTVRDIQLSRKFRMCHSGNLSTERNPELTFKALSELIDEGYDKLQFSIMGHINESTQSLINKYKLEDVVDCLGSFSYMESLRKMREYDCLVLLEAQLKKGIFFASKFTDYAQLGKPILAISPVDGFANSMIKQYGGGICVNNEDVGNIKSGIVLLYKAWQANMLTKNYPSQQLYEQFYPSRVINIYNDLLK